MSTEAISVGPSMDILSDTQGQTISVEPTTSSGTTQEPAAEKPTETPPETSVEQETPNKPTKMGQEEESEEAATTEDVSEAETETTEGGEVEPVNVSKYATEYYEGGELSEDSYKELAERGLDRDTVDMFMLGVEALQTQRGNALIEIAGGQEQYEAMVAYGSKNLTEAEQAAFNSAVDAAIFEGDTVGVSMLIPGIRARMSTEPNYVSSQSAPTNGGGVQPYASKTEMMADMRKPEYRKDAAFVAQVQRRLAVSEF